MILGQIFSKNWQIFLVVSLVYFLYSSFVLSPSSYKHFSLIDDGQSIQNSSYFRKCIFQGDECENLGQVLIEKNFGRFRPTYWLIQAFLYNIVGENALAQHKFRVFLVGPILLFLLIFLVLQAGGGKLSALISSAIFLSSFSFSENLIRLGPVEPYQVIILALFSLVFLSQRYMKSNGRERLVYDFLLILILTTALTTKETSVILIIPVLIFSFVYRRAAKDRISAIAIVSVALFITLVGRLLARPDNSPLAYIENFEFDPGQIASRLYQYFQIISDGTRPFFKTFALLLTASLFTRKLTRELLGIHFLYWLLLFLLSVLIILPWRYVLERYALPPLFSFSILAGLTLSKFWEVLTTDMLPRVYPNTRLGKVFYLSITSFIFSNLFFIGFPVNLAKTLNYNTWYKDYLRFEAEQVEAFSKLGKDVYINAIDNLNNWEVLYEIPIHLKFFYNQDYKIKLVDKKPDKGGFLFTRKPFDNMLREEVIKRFRLLESETYEIKQIDPLEFQKKFLFRPIGTLQNPPYKEEKFVYYWEIREIK